MSNSTCQDCVVEVQAVPVKHGLSEVTIDPSSASTSKTYDPMDVSTFTPPAALPAPSITIEFCDRCRWLHRATWVCTELFLTFPPPALKGIYLVPGHSDETAGRFRVWLSTENGPALVWDRKVEGGFPELKILKQRIRDHTDPSKSLGHSDKQA